jgi:hypothetical protein
VWCDLGFHGIKGKGKVVIVDAMKANGESRGTAPLILDPYTRWERARSSLSDRLGKPQSRSGRFKNYKNLLYRNQPWYLCHPSRSLVTIPTKPAWYFCSMDMNINKDSRVPNGNLLQNQLTAATNALNNSKSQLQRLINVVSRWTGEKDLGNVRNLRFAGGHNMRHKFLTFRRNMLRPSSRCK